MAKALGSGRREQYLSNCLFNLEAKRSISGLKFKRHKALIRHGFDNIHSASCFDKQRDSLSAITLSSPGI